MNMGLGQKIGIGLVATWIAYLWTFGSSPQPPEINICSLEYRAAYLELHDSDAPLRRECPYAPWYKK